MATASPTSSVDSSLMLLDLQVCAHGKELCKECKLDSREDNEFVLGLTPVEGREPLEFDVTLNKENQPLCIKHKKTECKTCWGSNSIKKQVVKLQKNVKSGKKFERGF